MCSRFYLVSWSIYVIEIQVVDNDVVSVNIPENVTGGVAGNKNLPSNVLQVRQCKKFLAFCLLLAQLMCSCNIVFFLNTFLI